MKTYRIKLHLLTIIASICFSYSAVNAQKYKDRSQQKQNEEYRESQDNPDSLNNKRFIDRLVYGGNLMLELGNPTYVDLSPLIGYRITPRLQAGIGATYVYYRASISYYDQYGNLIGTVPVTSTLYGGRLYTQYDLLHDALRANDKLFGHFEYEILNVPYVNNLGTTGRAWMESPYIGVGYRSPIGRNGYINLTVLYNIDYARFQNINPYGSPLAIRIGFTL
jgi:hypothetical protein